LNHTRFRTGVTLSKGFPGLQLRSAPFAPFATVSNKLAEPAI